MSYTDRHIVETYSGLFEGLSSLSKIELTEFESTIMKKLVGQGVLTKEQYMKDIAAQRERS